jgi:hypothetical protein
LRKDALDPKKTTANRLSSSRPRNESFRYSRAQSKRFLIFFQLRSPSPRNPSSPGFFFVLLPVTGPRRTSFSLGVSGVSIESDMSMT